jgi:putative hemolysin
VTLEDIIEELVGDIDNVYERFPTHVYSYENNWIAGGSALMSKVCSVTGMSRQGDGTKNCTVAEWWQQLTENRNQESITIGEYVVTARKFKRKRAAEVVITKRNISK